jgi:hypothetical protein
MNEILSKLCDLTEEEKSQLSDEQMEVLEDLIGCAKPSISFSSATLYDCVRSDGLDLNVDFAITDLPTLHIPSDFATPIPSDFLSEQLRRIRKFGCWTAIRRADSSLMRS